MRNGYVSPYFSDMLSELEMIEDKHKTGLFTQETHEALEGLRAQFTNTDDLIDAVQKASRIIGIANAGLMNSEAFKADLTQYNPPSWKSYKPLDADIELQRSLGLRLFNVPDDQKATAHVGVTLGQGANHIVQALIEKLMEEKIPFLFGISDTTFSRLLLKYTDNDGIQRLADAWMKSNERVTHYSTARPNSTPASPVPQDKAKDAFYSKAIERVGKRTITGEVMFTLTAFPTEIDAQIDGIPLKEYLNLFFAMCDQPDEYVIKANEHLIAKLEKASTVRFTNSDGTDVSMSLIDTDGRHFTFANSQTKKNIPGSEVFSAPRRDSINGTIVSKGKFISRTDKDKIIVNLTMHFEQGKIAKFTADEGAQYFQEYLDRHPNNAYVGELGIGTNPHLKRHIANGLLVEKVSSSFHLALGEAYQITNYLGKPVHMNNGNDSLDHWDITTMLGDMYLDGQAVMKDGKFLDPELDVLNRGWNAVPVEERPDRWKDYAGPFFG